MIDASQQAALSAVVDLAQEPVDDARALVTQGVRPIDAVDRVVREANPRAVTAAAYIGQLRALDPHATDTGRTTTERAN